VDTKRESEIRERLEQLETENAQLHSQLASAVKYRNFAIVLVATAVVSLGLSWRFPGRRTVYVGLAGVGFIGVVVLLVYAKEPLVSDKVLRAIRNTRNQNIVEISQVLGTQTRVSYVPVPGDDVRMCISSHSLEQLSTVDGNKPSITKVDDQYCLLMEPTGKRLLFEAEKQAVKLPDNAESALPVLLEAVTDQFVLAETIEVITTGEAIGSGDYQVTVRVGGVRFGDATNIDHPISSLIGTGLATVIQTPVETTAATTDDRATMITFSWQNGPKLEQI